MTNIDFDTVLVKAAGVAGALVSMRFLSGSWPQRLSTACCGALLSYYVAPFIAMRVGIPEGFCGFLLGLFGMAIASRVWEWIQTTPVGALWEILLNKFKKLMGV